MIEIKPGTWCVYRLCEVVLFNVVPGLSFWQLSYEQYCDSHLLQADRQSPAANHSQTRLLKHIRSASASVLINVHSPVNNRCQTLIQQPQNFSYYIDCFTTCNIQYFLSIMPASTALTLLVPTCKEVLLKLFPTVHFWGTWPNTG